MLRIDSTKKTLIALERRTMRESGYWERRDIQEMICRTPGAFCEELGEKLCILGSEVQPSEFVQDRIDLLGVDSDGTAVITEIKRDSTSCNYYKRSRTPAWSPNGTLSALSSN
jgi:RecB family endonuclease NucS